MTRHLSSLSSWDSWLWLLSDEIHTKSTKFSTELAQRKTANLEWQGQRLQNEETNGFPKFECQSARLENYWTANTQQNQVFRGWRIISLGPNQGIFKYFSGQISELLCTSDFTLLAVGVGVDNFFSSSKVLQIKRNYI